MKLQTLALLALASATCGCTTIDLERHTLSQSESIGDLRYREVLNNLAMIAANHWALPSYCSIYTGTALVQDQVMGNPTTNIARETIAAGGTFTAIDQQALDIQFQRRTQGNWTLDPVVVPEKLVALRAMCWWALQGPEALRPEDVALLGEYPKRVTITDRSIAFLVEAGAGEDVITEVGALREQTFGSKQELMAKVKKKDAHWEALIGMSIEYAPAGYYFGVADDLAKIPPGWLQVGRPHDVPKGACYSAQCHGTAVWVMPEGIAGLSAFALVVQQIARCGINDQYYPKPGTAAVTKTKLEGAPLAAKIEVTVYVDEHGNVTPGLGQYAYPVKLRQDNAGADQHLRSQIAAAGGGAR